MTIATSASVLALFFAQAGGAFIAALVLAGSLFWLWMLVDCARYEKEGSTKVAWMLIILFVNVLGAPLYYFLRRAPRARKSLYHAPPEIYQPWRQK